MIRSKVQNGFTISSLYILLAWNYLLKKNHFPIIADILNTKSSLILHKHKIANDIDNSATF